MRRALSVDLAVIRSVYGDSFLEVSLYTLGAEAKSRHDHPDRVAYTNLILFRFM